MNFHDKPYFEALSKVTPEDYVVLKTGRTDIWPRDRFIHNRRWYYALTQPHGAQTMLGTLVNLGDGMEVGDVTAFPA